MMDNNGTVKTKIKNSSKKTNFSKFCCFTTEAESPSHHDFQTSAKSEEQGTNNDVSKAGGIGKGTNLQFSTKQKKKIKNGEIDDDDDDDNKGIGKKESKSRVHGGKPTKEDSVENTKDSRSGCEEIDKDYNSNTTKYDDSKNTKNDGPKATNDDGGNSTKEAASQTTEHATTEFTTTEFLDMKSASTKIENKHHSKIETTNSNTIINIPSVAEKKATSPSDFEKSNQNAPKRRESLFVKIIKENKFNIKETNFWKLMTHPNNRRSIDNRASDRNRLHYNR